MTAKPPAAGLKRYRVRREYTDVWSLEVDACDEADAIRIADALNEKGDIRVVGEHFVDGVRADELTNPEDWDDPADYGDNLPTASARDL